MSDLQFLTFIIMLISHVNDLLKVQTSYVIRPTSA